ncbi:hypothetical protein C8F01DRAFT_1253376 [Mycena amicta]|nr:hypothetical protein C8F01DRAFT_1253376 [Mycena amicta]
MDNAKAIDHTEVASSTLIIARHVQEETQSHTASMAKDGLEHLRIIMLGGDQTIASFHFDFLHYTTRNRCSQFSARCIRSTDPSPVEASGKNTVEFTRRWVESMVVHDEAVGFAVISTEDMDDCGIEAVIHNGPGLPQLGYRYDWWFLSFLSSAALLVSLRPETPAQHQRVIISIVSLRSAACTPEAGGWTTREVKRIVRGLNFVHRRNRPAYDHAETTSLAAANIVGFLDVWSGDY